MNWMEAVGVAMNQELTLMTMRVATIPGDDSGDEND